MGIQHIETVIKWYPKALTSIDTENTLLDTVEREGGLKPNGLMHADSMCRDEVYAIELWKYLDLSTWAT